MKRKLLDYEYVVWDWNGTLLDDTWLCRECLNVASRRFGGREVELPEYREIYTFPVTRVYEAVGLPEDERIFREASLVYIAEYERRRGECALHEGAVEVLEVLKKGGVKSAVFSAYEQGALERIIGERGLSGFFEKLSGNDSVFSNDKGERARGFFGGLGVEKGSVLYVGDTTHDGEIARELGVDCVLLARGHQARWRLEGFGARVVEGLREMMS